MADGEKSRRPPFAVSLPTSSFSVTAFAKHGNMRTTRTCLELTTTTTTTCLDEVAVTMMVGVLEKRANVTLIGGEVVIGKEARGNGNTLV
jgi:dynactin-4